MSSSTIILTPVTPPAAPSAAAAHSPRVTAWDLVDRIMSSLGGNPTNASARDFKTCILDAYREIETVHNWDFLTAYLRLNLSGKFAGDGITIAYDATGGAYERLLTLSGSTWPAWTVYGSIRIGTLVYQIAQVIDSTRLQLAEGYAPADDIASGTLFTLFRDTYTLPEDFVNADKGIVENTWGAMEHVRPHEWLIHSRYLEAYAQPRFYCYRGDPKIPGRLAISFFPIPDIDQTVDLIYRRKMRALSTFEQKTGTASVSMGSPTQVVLSGATFKAANVGDVIRLGTDPKNPPTDLTGDYPFAHEANITAVQDASTAIMDVAVTAAFTGMAYRISSPIDLERSAMLNAFIACAHKHLGMQRRFKPQEQQEFTKAYLFALELAKEADSRDSSQRAVDLRETLPTRPFVQVWN